MGTDVEPSGNAHDAEKKGWVIDMELAVSIKLIGKRLCQWDTGRQVKITTADGITVEKVQFAYERECEATTAEHEVQYDGTIIATIPDTMLVTGRNIFAYAVIVLENGGRTRYDQPFSVKPGPKPSGTVDPSDKEEVYSYEALEKRVAELEKGGPGGIKEEKDPTVPDWAKQPEKPSYTAEDVGAVGKDELPKAINAALTQAKESGVFDGKDGYTPIKGIDYFDGEKGDKGDKGDKGEQGIQGEKGADGYTPQKNVDYFDGKDGQNGKDGVNGKDGIDGKTPIKGTDYFTEADKAELVTDVLNSLPTWQGGAF